MVKTTKPQRPADRSENQIGTITQADRLLDHREGGCLLGLRCKTSHTLRAYAARGLIRAVRINSRVVRYSEASIRELIAGRVSA